MKLQAQNANVQKENLVRLVGMLSECKADDETKGEDHLNKISSLCSELAKISTSAMNTSEKLILANLVHKYFEKNSINNEITTVNLCRMVAQLLVHERNFPNLSDESKTLIKVRTRFFIPKI
jgi:hypothetical protein